MSHSGFEFVAYLGFLSSLRKSSAQFFIEGGQAVNYWAEYVDARCHKTGLRALRPFTSKDCDIWVGNDAWTAIKREAGDALIKSSSPADGQLGILRLREDPALIIDLMSNVYGIPVSEYTRLFERALDDGIVRVIDPISLLQSKCHCLLGLKQNGRQDERHVRIMSLVLPEYLEFQIQDVETSLLDERNVLKEIKHLRKILGTSVCRRALAGLSIRPNSLIPWETLRCSRSSRLAKFAAAEDKRTE